MSASPRDSKTFRRSRTPKPPRAKTTRSREDLRPRRSPATPPTAKGSRKAAARSLPPLLETLVWLQRGSSIVAVFLIGAALALYAATVYLQQQWSEAYQTLERLQRETRSLTAADETLKHQLAKQAESKETGLVFPSPDQTIYLYPAPADSARKPPAEGQQVQELPSSNAPLGY